MRKKTTSVDELPNRAPSAQKKEMKWGELSFEELVAAGEALRDEGLLDKPIFFREPWRFSALGWACHRLDAGATRHFLDLGASISAISEDGRTPAFIAGASICETFFNISSEKKWENCLAELLRAGVDINQAGRDRDGREVMLIDYAVGALGAGEGLGPLEWLLSRGAMVSAHEKPKSLAMLALRSQREDAMSLLLAAGLNVEGVDVSERASRGEPAAMRIKEVQDAARERATLERLTPEKPQGPRMGRAL